MTKLIKPVAWVKALLEWYHENRRSMPWRDRPTPYAVWISEIMLQQTQVGTVTPYYEKFLKCFPNVKRLADANEQEVLKSWEGLGYYSRARNLHKAARCVSRLHRGKLPSTALELQALPGIGEYTAAAIASIAFGQAAPSLDGNVLRVMARFRGIEDEIIKPAVRKAIKGDLERHIPTDKPGDFNQALMELGALVCRPRHPSCGTCPLKRNCVARRFGTTEQIPVKTRKGPIPRRKAVAGLILRNNKMLVSKRPVDQLLGGLWEFPGGQCQPRESLKTALSRTVAERSGLAIETARRLCTVEHTFSHFRLQLYVFECAKLPGRLKRGAGSDALRWMTPLDFRRLPLSKVTLKVMDAIESLS
jgi:A/G-specific adenine glycosylase